MPETWMLRKILGPDAVPLLDEVLDPLSGVMRNGSLHGQVRQFVSFGKDMQAILIPLMDTNPCLLNYYLPNVDMLPA